MPTNIPNPSPKMLVQKERKGGTGMPNVVPAVIMRSMNTRKATIPTNVMAAWSGTISICALSPECFEKAAISKTHLQ